MLCSIPVQVSGTTEEVGAIMLRSGTIHAVSEVARDAGDRIAVTIWNNPGKGVLVWAGVLHASALKKSADEVKSSDYSQRQIVNFSSWHDVWSYYQHDPEFAPLMAKLKPEVDERIAAGRIAAAIES